MKRLFASIALLALTSPLLHAQEPRPLPSDPLQARLARIFDRKEFEAKTFGPFRWMENGKAYTTLEDVPGSKEAKDLVRYDSATGARRVLVPATQLVPGAGAAPLLVEDYAWSDDGKKLLVFTNAKKVWRQNTRGDYWLLDVGSGSLRRDRRLAARRLADVRQVLAGRDRASRTLRKRPLGRERRERRGPAADLGRLRHDHQRHGRLGLRGGARSARRVPLEPGREGHRVLALRHDGHRRVLADQRHGHALPRRHAIPYPKAGTTNSEVKIGIVSASGGAPRWAALPGDPRNTYAAAMEWVDDPQSRRPAAQPPAEHRRRLARGPRDRRDAADAPERDDAWVDVFDGWRWLPGGRDLLWVSERDGWRHAYAAPRDGGAPRLLTPGDFDLAEVVGVDEKAGSSTSSPRRETRPSLPLSRPPGREGRAERVTPAAAAGTHAYRISPDGRFAVHTFSTYDRPPVIDLVRLPSHERVRVLEDNAALATAVAAWTRPPTEFFQVEIPGGVSMDALMIRPERFDASKKYPLVMYVYGEPAGAQVRRQVGRGPLPLSPGARGRGVRRRMRRQPGHAVAQGTRVAQDHLWRGRRPRHGGSDRGGPGAAGLAHLPRPRARRVVGLERRRLDDAEPPLPLAGPLQGRHVRGAGPGPDALRHDLPGALHGPAERERGGLPEGLTHQLRRGPAREAAPRPRLRRRQRPLPGLGEADQPARRSRASRSTSWSTRTARTRSTRETGRRSTFTRGSRGICSRICRPARNSKVSPVQRNIKFSSPEPASCPPSP